MTKFTGPFEDVEVRESKAEREEVRKPWFDSKVAAVMIVLGGAFALKDLVSALIKAFGG